MYKKVIKVSEETYARLGELQQELNLGSRHEVIKYLVNFYQENREQTNKKPREREQSQFVPMKKSREKCRVIARCKYGHTLCLLTNPYLKIGFPKEKIYALVYICPYCLEKGEIEIPLVLYIKNGKMIKADVNPMIFRHP